MGANLFLIIWMDHIDEELRVDDDIEWRAQRGRCLRQAFTQALKTKSANR